MGPINKTLVIRFSSIGDIVLTSPLLRVLRARFPKSQIDFVTRTEFAELIRSNQNVNRTFEFDAAGGFEALQRLKKTIREERYDLLVDLHDSLRSKYLRSIRGPKRVVVDKRILERSMLVKFKKNVFRGVVSVVDRYIETLKDFGIENDQKGLELHIPDEVLFGVSGKLAPLKLNRFEKVVALCPGARHFTKRWPAERFARVGSAFVQKLDAKVLLFGGAADEPLCRQIAWELNNQAGTDRASSFAGHLGLLETAAAMQYCDVVITNDTGLMHIAAAMRRKIVAIFGSTVKEFGFSPYDPSAVVVERPGLPCRPCSHIGRSECPERHFKCMTEIDPESVFLRARELSERTVE
ncbi:MAG: lipopolysaccharide heptosyltransferase II [Ignavibacteria bacterium GWA2_54_16]|nr:MAG: lipopolysaccharide heptosyltransferase II [Ignavibacteria bacterium GWA2_54_16]